MSVESFLHKTAKEILYVEIEKKSGVEWKTNTSFGFEPLIQRSEYRKECVLMEFPTGNRSDNEMYPDEIGVCRAIKQVGRCNLKGYRFNNGKGYCSCSQCGFIDYTGVIIHDIAAFWKGTIAFAIEIINKHPPVWIDNLKPNYPVYIVDATNILKRVTDTPVFVTDII